MHRPAFTLTLLLVVVGALGADDQIFSGPQAGEKLTPFKVHGVLGSLADKDVDLVEHAKGGPTMIVFVHELTRPSRQALLGIDRFGSRWAKDGLQTHFVWLSADRAKTEEYLKNARASIGLECPVSISLDGAEGPGNYGLNRKVTLTILVAKDNKVVANHAIVQPNETDAPKVLADVAKLLDKQAPTLEEVRGPAQPARRPANEPEDANAVREKMRGLLKETDKDKIAQTFRGFNEWAGRDRPKNAWLKGYLELVFEKSKYGTAEVQDAYQAWKKSKEEKK